MARVVKIVPNANIWLDIVTKFEDTTSSTKTLKVGDTIEGLRWIEDESIKTVTGIVKEINYTPAGGNSTKANPTDTLSSDVKFTTLVVDASSEYQSNIVTLPINEIVEDEGVFNVVKVDAVPQLNVTLSIEYTDGTTENSDLSVGDILDNVTIMGSAPGKPDITGKFTIKSFVYAVSKGALDVLGFNLENASGNVIATWKKIIKFKEIPNVKVSGEGLAAVAELLESDDPEVEVIFAGDVVVPDREDGRITTVFVPEGKTLDVDLAGHTLDVAGYAFYSTGGTIVINDSTGEGVIKTRSHNTYGALYSKNGKIIINGGKIDTSTDTDEEDPNYMYGVVLAGSGTLEMNGGEIHTVAASGAAITNGTAEGAGAVFTFAGDSKLRSDKSYAIYMADNKTVIVKDNAYIEGICMRMGDVIIQDNAQVVNVIKEEDLDDFGAYMANYNGVYACRPGIIAMCGMYQSVGTGTNDINITIKDNALVTSGIGEALGICKVSAKYDQIVNVTIDKAANVKGADGYEDIHVYEFEECQELAAASGKTITKGSEVTVSVSVDEEPVYPTPVTEG